MRQRVQYIFQSFVIVYMVSNVQYNFLLPSSAQQQLFPRASVYKFHVDQRPQTLVGFKSKFSGKAGIKFVFFYDFLRTFYC